MAVLPLIRGSLPGCSYSWFAFKPAGRLLLLVLTENLSTSLYASDWGPCCVHLGAELLVARLAHFNSRERVVWWPKHSRHSSHFSCLTLLAVSLESLTTFLRKARLSVIWSPQSWCYCSDYSSQQETCHSRQREDGRLLEKNLQCSLNLFTPGSLFGTLASDRNS